MIFFVHSFMIAPVYETYYIIIAISTDYTLSDHWNAAWIKKKLLTEVLIPYQSFMCKTSIKVMERKEPL